MSYYNQQPTYYYDPSQTAYYQSSQAGSIYSPTSASNDASMTRGYSGHSNTSYSSSASPSSPESFAQYSSPGLYSSPTQLSYKPTYPDAYNSAQEYPITSTYPYQPQKPSRAEAKPTKAPKSYPCLHEGCKSQAQFTRAADLERHHKTVHFVEKRLDCPERWCGRVGDYGFTRKDHLIEHRRSFHVQDVPKTPRGSSKKPRHS
ncbi:Zinc finger, C2H2-like [Lasallia pustulata]|uniref:Zinc finger, C2H2-like n=1 Tax=Lasallia pustulata TaxID=136370 RepID=A0A1W5D1Q7_9LECA|nr:Zinc finger, C2H2-like [Lasallia pustulata]